MRHNRRRRIESEGSAKSVQLLSLALFVMLLAFFIVLNAISSFEENKIDPIMGSLENTFSSSTSPMPQRRPSARPSQEDEQFKGEGDTTKLDRLRDLFRGRLAAIEITENKEQGIMMVEVPYADLSTVILAIDQPTEALDTSNIPFLPTLVTLLQTKDSSEPYRMDILLKTAADPVDLKLLQPLRFKEARDKVGKLARRLEEAGISGNFISIGLRQGPENMVDLIFTPYQKIDLLENRDVSEEAEVAE